MSKQELLNKIINNIDDVSKIGNKFKKNKQIPKIEIDLALSKIRNLYDLLLLFDDANMDSFEQIGKDIDADTISKTKAVDSDEKKKTNI
ncbi:MAG: hypothetical protein U9R54_08360, partial [Bacteroidota bacterium]|nr:hypothetical protein [Bacteroidota bacterium]